MDKTNIISIDPGKNGGIAVYENNIVSVTKMPETPLDILKLLNKVSRPRRCFLEVVHSMPGQSGMAMFTFGKGYGWLEMALLALDIPTETITPQKWTKSMALGTKSSCASSTEWKNKLKSKAQQLYPSIHITLWNADALLILHYCMNIR